MKPLTAQKVSDFVDPVLGVFLVVLLEPDECALDVRLWWHGTETQSRISADDALVELVLGMRVDDGRVENAPHRQSKGGKDSVEDEVEEKDFALMRREKTGKLESNSMATSQDEAESRRRSRA